jgi:hypothetical protein
VLYAQAGLENAQARPNQSTPQHLGKHFSRLNTQHLKEKQRIPAE